jgi:hypothetical protein
MAVKFLSLTGLQYLVSKVIGTANISGIGDGTLKGAVSTLKGEIGTANISGIGDGTIKGAVSTLNSNANKLNPYYYVDGAGVLKDSGNTKWGTSWVAGLFLVIGTTSADRSKYYVGMYYYVKDVGTVARNDLMVNGITFAASNAAGTVSLSGATSYHVVPISVCD